MEGCDRKLFLMSNMGFFQPSQSLGWALLYHEDFEEHAANRLRRRFVVAWMKSKSEAANRDRVRPVTIVNKEFLSLHPFHSHNIRNMNPQA